MKHDLYNVAHPMAKSGQPIFIPYGEWKYDASTRQRLDRRGGGVSEKSLPFAKLNASLQG